MRWLVKCGSQSFSESCYNTEYIVVQGKDQPGKIANPARGQLNRIFFLPVLVRAWEFGLARQVWQSRLASACSSPYSDWIWCLPIRDSSRLPRRHPYFYLHRHTPSGQSRVYRVTQLRTDGVHCRESAGIGPLTLKIVPNGCWLGRSPWTNKYAPLFPTPLLVWSESMSKVPA